MKIASYTLGCKVNSFETSALLQMFKENGFEIVSFDEMADVYLINTCSVTNQSDVKSRKAIRQAIRKNENAVIAVMGCYSQIKSEEIKKIPGVDIILGTANKGKMLELVKEELDKRRLICDIVDRNKIIDFENLEATEFEHTRAFLKIQDGCDNFCSYCIIPYARGRMRSRSVSSVLDECQKITEKGYREIVLTGIHTGGYGKDINYPFSRLVKDILEKTNKLDRLRISSIEINQIDDELLEILKKDNRLCHHLHLPIQSGSNKVLHDMNRKYTVEQYMEKINKIRSIIPDIAITTDIIVGYPTETEEDFKEVLENVKMINFSYMHIFPFSKRNGTVAAKYEELNGLIMKDRIRRLNEINLVNAKSYAKKFENKILDFIPEEYENGFLIGHTNNYLKVKVLGNREKIGQMLEILIEKGDFPQNNGKIL